MSSTQSISIKSAARKLPIKRKSPDGSNPNPNLTPKSKSKSQPYQHERDDEEEETNPDDHKPLPFKFHRIWNESDEIRFLQGLLDSSSQGLIFPRDLALFYDRFSTCMSQPYTKSQLSEKLRRLRKKFRVISTRISHGLEVSLLSHHDQALFEVSKKLWDPDSNSESPFKKKSASVSVKVSFSPVFTPSMSSSIPVLAHVRNEICGDEDDCEVDVNVKAENFDGGHQEELSSQSDRVTPDDGTLAIIPMTENELTCKNDGFNGDETRQMVMKTVMDVFDKSLKEARMALMEGDHHCESHKSSLISNESSQQGKTYVLMKRCREQRIAELDVLARRMRLVLENSVHHQ